MRPSYLQIFALWKAGLSAGDRVACIYGWVTCIWLNCLYEIGLPYVAGFPE